MSADFPWKLYLFGRPALRSDDGRTVDFPKFAYAIFVLLTLDRVSGSAARDDVAQFLWPQTALEQQQSNLRTLLKRIRAAQLAAGVEFFAIEKQRISLHKNAAFSDLHEFRRMSQSGSPHDVAAAAALIKGDLLEGCDQGLVSFELWLQNHRAVLINALLLDACKLINSDAMAASPEAREALALKLIELEPGEEDAYCALLSLHAARRDFDGVKRTYDRLVSNLKSEIGCQPSEQTKALYRSLVTEVASAKDSTDRLAAFSSEPPEATTFHPASKAEGPILKFPAATTAQSGTTELRHRALVDDLIVQLWKPRAIKIVVEDDHLAPGAADQSREPANVYKMHLGLSDQSIRLSARLGHAQSGELLWAESYQFSADTHERLIARIANSVLAKLEDHQIEIARECADSDLPGFAFVARGNRALLNANLPSVRRARRLFRVASEITENDLMAQTGIARTYRLEWILRAGQDPSLLASAREISRSMLELNPESHLAHRELGVTALYQRQHELAREHIHRARELHPHDPELLFDFADVLIADGAHEEALQVIGAVKQVDYKLADFRNWIAASGHYVLGDYKAALTELREMRNPDATFRLRAACHAMLGDYEEAREFRNKALDDNPGFDLKAWMSMCPVRLKTDIEHLRDGCRAAGFK